MLWRVNQLYSALSQAQFFYKKSTIVALDISHVSQSWILQDPNYLVGSSLKKKIYFKNRQQTEEVD